MNKILIKAALILVCTYALPAQATIISVDGLGDSGQIVDSGEAVAISFTLTSTFTDVSIGASISCFACQGGIWLHSTQLGAGASFGDSLGAEAFDGTSVSPFFSGLTLDAGLYFLILSIDAGFAIWEGSIVPDIILDSAAQLGFEFEATDLEPFVPFSDFRVLFVPGALHYTVSSGVSTPVPEPGTLALFGIGLLGMAAARRRKKV